MATTTEVLQTLEALGSEQTRKTWRRHGASGPMFGVKFGDLDKLVKRHRGDHPLALGLWSSGNLDARTLAAMIADPAQMSRAALERWLADVSYAGVIDYLARLAAKTADALACAAAWTTSPDERTARAGWTLVAQLAADERIGDDVLQPYLRAIEPQIHQAVNSVRDAMHRALIAIGGHSDALARTATAAAKRIGPVEIDHGDTSCKTPEPIDYIAKIRAHATRKAGTAAARAATTKPPRAASPAAKSASTKKSPAKPASAATTRKSSAKPATASTTKKSPAKSATAKSPARTGAAKPARRSTAARA